MIRTEQQLLDATIDLAMRCRWAVHHDRPARRSGNRWATAIQGHAGFPDLVLACGGVVLFRELKGYDARNRLGKLSPEQRDWGRQLDPNWAALMAGQRVPWPPTIETDCGPVGVPPFAVWTPADWHAVIVPTLTSRTRLVVTDLSEGETTK